MMNTYPVFRNKIRTQLITESIQREKSRSLYLIYASQFTEYQAAIEVAKDTFSQEQIWPDQCDYIMYAIGLLQKMANRIANLVTSEKKQTGSNSRYSILVNAQHLCDQIEILSTFIREYKEISKNQTMKKSKHRLIVSSLYNVESSLSDLLKELDKIMK